MRAKTIYQLIASLCMIVSLCTGAMALQSCSGAQTPQTAGEQSVNHSPFDAVFNGTWKVVSFESGEGNLNADAIGLLNELDMSLELDMGAEGTCEVKMAGEKAFTGTWYSKSAVECIVTLKGYGEISGVLGEDGVLVFEQKGSKLSFEKHV